MITLPGFQQRWDEYEAMDKQPFTLRLKLRMGQQLAGYDPVSISGLLGWCAMMELTDGRGVPPSDEPYLIPTPIHCLWRDGQGLPLWECTPLTHRGVWGTDVAYRHKKHQSGRFTKGRKFKGRMYFNISPSDGRFMERRVPVPTMVAESWECRLVANPHEVARLLGYVYAVGKEHNRGFGVVDHWEGEPCGAVPLVDAWRLTRSIPVDAAHVLGEYEPGEPPSWGSWTDPGWVRGSWTQRWQAGTPVRLRETDFFDAP